MNNGVYVVQEEERYLTSDRPATERKTVTILTIRDWGRFV